MSRLTARNKNGKAYYPCCFDKCNGAYGNCSECKFELDICEKLAHYEDLEEAGRLIELPCKVGKKEKEQILKFCSDNGFFK